MNLTPYDWGQSLAARMEYCSDRLKEGSPVLGLSLKDGVLLFTLRRRQRKLFEVYDRIMFGGLGNQSDVEAMRIAAIDFAHREGFQRSPDDVTLQRLVGSVLSPALKQSFADPYALPLVFRGLLAEVGKSREEDTFFELNFDGDYQRHERCAAVAGSAEIEAVLQDALMAQWTPELSFEHAVAACRAVWEAAIPPSEADPAQQVEAAWLERRSSRSSRLRLLDSGETQPAPLVG